MTIALIYVRKISGGAELVMASDSRLNGETWDGCQKIFPLTRGDCAITFTGWTLRFYPILSHIIGFCNLHKINYTRAKRIDDLAADLKMLINDLHRDIAPPNPDDRYDQDMKIVLGGYCWASAKFTVKVIYYNRDDRCMAVKTVKISERPYVIGDAVPKFKESLNRISVSTSFEGTDGFKPLRRFQRIIDANEIRSIGGVVQGVKVYQHLNCRPLRVKRANSSYVFGRRLYDWEAVDYETSQLDLDGATPAPRA